MTTPDTPTPALELMADRDGERLDQFLARRLDGASRSQARQLVDDALVRIDGALERPAYKLRFGELVAIFPRSASLTEAPSDIAFDVVYEDDQLAVINKPARLTVHPAPGETQPTLIGAILHRWPELANLADDDPETDPQRPGLVHRLDRDTTGLLMIAKSAQASRSLRDQLRQRTMDKHYLAITIGAPDPPAGLIDAPIGRDPSNPRRMTILDRGRPSQTGYDTVERFRDAALLECHLITGRTHQIRVHLAAVGHPIAGDTTYGMPTALLDRQALHARKLTLQHPTRDEPLSLSVEPPADFQHLLSRLRDGELLLGDQQVPQRSANDPHRPSRRGRRRRTQRIR